MGVSVKMLFSQDLQEQANNAGQTRNIVIEPVLVLRVPFVPAGIKFGLMIITNGIDFSKKNQFSIEVKNETGEVLYTTGVQNLEGNPNDRFDNFNFNLNLDGIPIKKEETLTAEFMLNGDKFTEELQIVANENLLDDTTRN